MNNIINCARKILFNTTEPYRQDIEYFIEDYQLYQTETDFQNLLNVFSRLDKENFDISEFELYEVPHPSVYVFYNKYKNQMFDICIDNFCNTDEYACIAYINNKNDECVANTIPEAIKKYNREFLQ